MHRIAIIVAVAIAGTLTAMRADAQATGGSRGGPAPGGHLPPPKQAQDPRQADAPVSLTGQTQTNLDRLEEDLRINAAQQKAWDAYSKRVLRLADDISRARFAARDAQNETITAPQLFDRITETAQNRLTAVEEVAEAGRALYARLSPEQQRLADRRLAVVAVSLANGLNPGVLPRTDDPPRPGARPVSP